MVTFGQLSIVIAVAVYVALRMRRRRDRLAARELAARGTVGVKEASTEQEEGQ